jgi:hypothetical protein
LWDPKSLLGFDRELMLAEFYQHKTSAHNHQLMFQSALSRRGEKVAVVLAFKLDRVVHLRYLKSWGAKITASEGKSQLLP